MSLLNLHAESVVLTEERVALLGEVVHLRARLAKVAFRVVQRRFESVDEVDVGLEIRLAVRELLREASDLEKNDKVSKALASPSKMELTCASCSSNFLATLASMRAESVELLPGDRTLVPIVSIELEFREFAMLVDMLDELEVRTTPRAEEVPPGGPGSDVGRGGGGIEGGGVGGGGLKPRRESWRLRVWPPSPLGDMARSGDIDLEVAES